MPVSWSPALLGLLATAACTAVRPLPAPTPELPLAGWERLELERPSPLAKAAAGASSPALAKSDPTRKPTTQDVDRDPVTNAAAPAANRGCLAELAERKLAYDESAPVLGITTPVVVAGPIGKIRYFSHEKKPLVLDCRLALALLDISDDLAALGVTRVRYSGAYVYRTSHPGRMSMHAYGLAIDLHAFEIGGELLEVKKAFQRGRGTRCASGMAPLNLIACRVRAQGLFNEQIGPDDNAAHRDHFHLGLKPLPGELAADLPWPKPARRTSKLRGPAQTKQARAVKAKPRNSRARSAR